MIKPEDFSVPFIHVNEIEQHVTLVLDKYWDNKLPIDIELICEKMDINLIPIPGLKSLSSTDGFLPRSLNEIYWDPNVVEVRVRFTVAHELGHFILHKNLISDLNFSSIEEWKDFCSNIHSLERNKAESQANIFAAKILVPKDLLVQEIINMKSEISTALKALHNNDSELLLEYVCIPIAKIFKVSEETIKYRILNEEIDIKKLIEEYKC